MCLTPLTLSSRSLELQHQTVQRAVSQLASGRLDAPGAGPVPGEVQFIQSGQATVRSAAEVSRGLQLAIDFTRFAMDGVQGVMPVLQQMRELLLRGANDSLNAEQKAAVQDEIDQLKPMVLDAKAIALYARFNYEDPFAIRTVVYRTGTEVPQTMTVDYNPLALTLSQFIFNQSAVRVDNLPTALSVVDQALGEMQTFVGYLAGQLHRMTAAVDANDNRLEQTARALSVHRDTDVASAAVALKTAEATFQTGLQARSLTIEQARRNVNRMLEGLNAPRRSPRSLRFGS